MSSGARGLEMTEMKAWFVPRTYPVDSIGLTLTAEGVRSVMTKGRGPERMCSEGGDQLIQKPAAKLKAE